LLSPGPLARHQRHQLGDGAIGVTDIITVDQAGFGIYRTGAGKRFKNLFLS